MYTWIHDSLWSIVNCYVIRLRCRSFRMVRIWRKRNRACSARPLVPCGMISSASTSVATFCRSAFYSSLFYDPTATSWLNVKYLPCVRKNCFSACCPVRALPRNGYRYRSQKYNALIIANRKIKEGNIFVKILRISIWKHVGKCKISLVISWLLCRMRSVASGREGREGKRRRERIFNFKDLVSSTFVLSN